jgi:hypothetical protein
MTLPLGRVHRQFAYFILAIGLPTLLGPGCDCSGSSNHRLNLTVPAGLTATATSPTIIVLMWTNRATDAVSLEIDRSVDNGPFVLLTTIPATQSNYSDTGLTPGTEYCYELRPVNGTQLGFFTSPACASTILVSSPAPTPDPKAGIPTARMGHSAVYDQANDRILYFGGLTGTGVTDELWILSLATPSWTLVAKSGLWPAARMGHTALLDPNHNRMVLFDGYDSIPGDEMDNLMSLDLGSLTWTSLLVTGSPSTPQARQGHVAIFNPANSSMVMFGGTGFDFTLPSPALVSFGDVWELTLPTPGTSSVWTEITPATPPPASQARWGHATIYDPTGLQMVVSGGNAAVQPGVSPLGDVLALNLTTPAWSTITPAGGPTARFGHSAVLNGTHTFVFGGYTGTPSAELWRLDLGATPSWTQMTLGTQQPGARLGHASVLRSSSVVIFGGGSAPLTPAFADVWIFGM